MLTVVCDVINFVLVVWSAVVVLVISAGALEEGVASTLSLAGGGIIDEIGGGTDAEATLEALILAAPTRRGR